MTADGVKLLTCSTRPATAQQPQLRGLETLQQLTCGALSTQCFTQSASMPTMVRDDGPTVSDYLGKIRKRHALCAMLRSSSCDLDPIHGKESMLCSSTFQRESLPNLKTSNDYVLRVWIFWCRNAHSSNTSITPLTSHRRLRPGSPSHVNKPDH